MYAPTKQLRQENDHVMANLDRDDAASPDAGWCQGLVG
jgi:hypothetical protein